MNKIKIFFLISLLSFAGGCTDYLVEDTTGVLYGDNVLTTENGLDAALTGAYLGLFQNGFFKSSVNGVMMGGDDITTHPASNKAAFRELDQFVVSTTNQYSNDIYSACYKGIQGANNVINYSAKATGNAANIDGIVGEAYFLRAFSYFWLTRLWGEVPLVLTGTYTDDLLTIKKATVQEIYDQIVADLKVAEAKLPNRKRDPGRSNAGAAKALLADVYLTMAGWPLKQTDKYELAAAKAKEVIDQKELYGFQLLPTFAAVFANDPTVSGTAESVFQLNAVSQLVGNQTYGFTAMPGEENGFDDFFAELSFFNEFPEGPRKDATFRTEFGIGTPKTAWQNSKTKHPYYHKWYIKGDQKAFKSSLPTILMRYAHVLTTYAEAKARSVSGPDQAAYDALNQVRLRGREPGTAALTPASGLSAEAFAEAVVQERAWEFAAERTRWFDLIRLEKLEDAIADKDPNDLQPIQPITKAKYWLPLPYVDTNLNPNL